MKTIEKANEKTIEKSMYCPICMELIMSCRVAVCGHTFCHQCITECLIRKKECPQCRKIIRKKILQPFPLIDNSVKMFINGTIEDGNDELKKSWDERMQLYQ